MHKNQSNVVFDEDMLPSGRDDGGQISNLYQIWRRQKRSVIGTAATIVALALFFICQSVTRYTASSSIMIDSKQVGLSAGNSFEGALAFDTGAVDSQVLLLKSDRLAGNVIDRLKLLHNPLFYDPPRSLIVSIVSQVKAGVSKLIKAFGIDLPRTEYSDLPVDLQRHLLVEKLQSYLQVTRSARTYVITVEYTDADPALARTIAQTYAAEYLADQLESRFETSRRAAAWLEERTQEVKDKAATADRTAQAFRSKHKLTEASGRLINEQALTDVNTQLSVARNDLTSAQAKYERIKQIVDTKDYTAASFDALANPLISSLRAKYLDAFRKNADITSRLGVNHNAAVKAREEMNAYSKAMFEEMTRMLQSYQSEVQIAIDRVSTIERSIERIREVRDVDSAAMATLKAREQEAATYNNLYSLYLQKAQDLIQQQSIPISDARIISDAAFPMNPSQPKRLLIVLGAVVVGSLAGIGVAGWREFQDRGFRTSAQIRDELGLDFLAYLPWLPQNDFEPLEDVDRHEETSPHERVFQSRAKAFDVVYENPMSQFAEAVRSLRLSSDHHFGVEGPHVVGFVSTFPNEGKSTIAKNYSTFAALQGHSTLLIDCDLRNPQLTRSLTPTAKRGLFDLLQESGTRFDEIVYREATSGLTFLPASARGRVPATGELLGSAEMRNLLKGLREKYSVIVIDLAPLSVVKDAVAASAFIEGYNLIIEWGKTPRKFVIEALVNNPAVASRVIGVGLSKVDVEQLGLFDQHTSYGYYGYYFEQNDEASYSSKGQGVVKIMQKALGALKRKARFMSIYWKFIRRV